MKPPISYARSAQAARKRGVLFAHLKCAPVRRALSATDSVCSLLQDGGSAPIHFLLIASQLSLSIRIKTRRFPAEPPGRSYSISSLTNGGRRRGLGPVLLCFFYVPIQRWMWSFQRWLQRSPTWSSVCVCAPLFFGKTCSPLGHERELRFTHSRCRMMWCSVTCLYKLIAVGFRLASFGFM